MGMTDWRSGKRRRYTVEFKRQVVAEASAEGVSAASVARRHGLNANLIFNWRRRHVGDRPVNFVPALIVPEAPPADGDEVVPGGTAQRLEVAGHGGCGLAVDGDFDAGAFRRLLAVVEDR